MKFSIIQLIWICLLGLSRQRVYISNSNEGIIPNDITNEFSDQINDNLLSRTLSEGRRDNQMAYKQAGLQLQNKSIDRTKMDSVGKKLLDQYDEAIKEIKEEKKSTFNIKKEKDERELNKIATGPQERKLYQTFAAPMMMAQPQIAYQQPQIAYQQPQITYQQPQIIQQQQQYVPQAQPRTMYNNMVPVNNQQVTSTVQTANQSAAQTPNLTNSQTPTTGVKADTTATDKKLDDKKAVANTDTTKPLTVKTNTKDSAKRKLWRRRRRRRRRRNRRRHHRHGRHGRHGRHRRRRITPAQRYAKKIKSKRNMTLMNQSLKLKLQKAQISLQSRGQFDRLREKKLKGAAELWTRTFIYDAVLLTEKILYQKHRSSVRAKMGDSAKAEAQETIDIAKFYNTYYGKSPNEYKAEDLQFHIFD